MGADTGMWMVLPQRSPWALAASFRHFLFPKDCLSFWTASKACFYIPNYNFKGAWEGCEEGMRCSVAWGRDSGSDFTGEYWAPGEGGAYDRGSQDRVPRVWGLPNLGAEDQVPSEGRITGGHARGGEQPPEETGSACNSQMMWGYEQKPYGEEQPQGPLGAAWTLHWFSHPWTLMFQLIFVLI